MERKKEREKVGDVGATTAKPRVLEQRTLQSPKKQVSPTKKQVARKTVVPLDQPVSDSPATIKAAYRKQRERSFGVCDPILLSFVAK